MEVATRDDDVLSAVHGSILVRYSSPRARAKGAAPAVARSLGTARSHSPCLRTKTWRKTPKRNERAISGLSMFTAGVVCISFWIGSFFSDCMYVNCKYSMDVCMY